jgi:hypothetical protein
MQAHQMAKLWPLCAAARTGESVNIFQFSFLYQISFSFMHFPFLPTQIDSIRDGSGGGDSSERESVSTAA